jgi:hypothetical protein
MATYPAIPLSALGERFRERTQPLAPDDEDFEYAHAKLCEGMMLPFAQLAELVDPPDPLVPWEPLFNVDICPGWALPWLGQLVGVRVPSTMDPEDARIFIKELGAFARGSPDAIMAAAKFALTGSKNVFLRERDGGDAYHLEVVTLVSETPDPALVRQYVLLQKPGGITLGSRTTTAWDYQEMTTEYTGQKYKDVPADYPTYGDLVGGPLL